MTIRFAKLFCVLLFQTFYLSGQSIDSLQSIIQATQNINLKLDSYTALINTYSRRNLDSALIYICHALSISEKAEDNQRIDLYMASAKVMSMKKVSDSCFILSNKAFDLALAKNDTIRIIKAYANLSRLHNRNSDLIKAQDYINKALQLATIKQDIALINKYRIELAHYFFNNRDLKKASEVLALVEKDLEKEAGDENRLAFCLENAMVNGRKNELALSLHYAKEALRIAKHKSDYYNQCLSYANMIWSYIILFDNTKSKNYQDSAFAMIDSTIIMSKLCGNVEVRANAYNARTYILNVQKKYNEAIQNAYDHLTEIKNCGIAYEVGNIYGGLSDSYQGLKNVDSTIKYLMLSDEIMDSIRGKNIINRMEAEQLKADFELKELKFSMEQEKILFNHKRAILIRNFLFATLFLLGLIFFLWYAYNKQKLMKKQQKEFSQKLILIQEAERSKIAMELHDNIGQNLLLAKNHLRSIEENFNQARNSMTLVEKSLEDIRSLSKQLHPHLLNTIGFTKTVYQTIKNAEEASGIFFSAEIEDNIDDLLPQDKFLQLYRIIQEAINNILKHSKASAAKIEIHPNQDNLVLIIQDNGIGFDNAEKSGGFGFISFAERTDILGGSFKTFSEAKKGVKHVFTIPIKP